MPRAAFIYESALSQHVLRPDHPMRPARLRQRLFSLPTLQ